MFPVPLSTSLSSLRPTLFWDVVMLYHNRPHLINRKLLAALQVVFCKISFSLKEINDFSELFTRSAILYEIRKLKCLSKDHITEDFIKNIVECYDKSVVLVKLDEDEFNKESSGVFISIRILLPRNKACENHLEVVVLDKNKNSAIFHAVSEKDKFTCSPPFPYELQLDTSSHLKINLANVEQADTTHAEWLALKLFPKLLKWSENENSQSVRTLSLIGVDQYCLTYSSLKQRYSDQLVKDWPSKTKTNPQKYIFEDLAIASYLICLWTKYGMEDVRFVDCGCGNGLLVYILNQEGFEGYGIEVRKRPIWEIYPKSIRLEVGTITPNTVFPDTTWLIGNHCDELTPWIPVIALKSSPKTNHLVLPCCPYDFSGQKYIRKNTSVSQYSDYMDYVKSISGKCGFRTEIDKLRIPSTKRTCLIGVRRNTDPNWSQQKNIEEIDKFIESRLTGDFVPRSNEEKVRNCTQLDKKLIQRIVSTSVACLLSSENFILKSTKEKWNAGSSLSLKKLSQSIDPEDLNKLKKECGGLQTLLRNHRYLFQIMDGEVKLRQPLKLCDETKYRDKPCWFLEHHPNGCLYSAEECAYFH